MAEGFGFFNKIYRVFDKFLFNDEIEKKPKVFVGYDNWKIPKRDDSDDDRKAEEMKPVFK